MSAVTAADLAAVPLFAALDEADLAELASRFESKEVSAGVRLVGEGASGYSFFVLRDGDALVTVDGAEVATLGGVRLIPTASTVANPGFDVTPARLVTAIITERGVCPASREGLLSLFPERA